jgi:phage terminase small subunit
VKKLTHKQHRFVDEYLIDLNASAAARRAGYAHGRADAMGYENLRKPEIAAAVQEARQKLAEQTGRTVAQVMADIGRVRNDAMREVEDQRTGALAMLSHKDALKALELEGKHLGAFAERVEHTGKNGGPIESEVVHFYLPANGR